MLKNIVVTFGTSIAILCVNIATGILTARLLGPAGKGELTAVMIWPNVLAVLGSLGLVELVVYFTGREGNDVPPIWTGAIFAGIFQSIVLIPIGLILLPLLLHQYNSVIIATGLLFLLFIPLNLLTLYQNSIFQGRLQMRTFNLVRFLVIRGLPYWPGVPVGAREIYCMELHHLAFTGKFNGADLPAHHFMEKRLDPLELSMDAC